MPQTSLVFYQEDNGEVPVLEWLRELRHRDRKGYAKCVAQMRLLAAFGHELRRPHVDYLRDSIYELRTKSGRVNYRILYFFHGQNIAILAHALTKKGKVPDVEINRAIRRKQAFEQDADRHGYEEEEF